MIHLPVWIGEPGASYVESSASRHNLDCYRCRQAAGGLLSSSLMQQNQAQSFVNEIYGFVMCTWLVKVEIGRLLCGAIGCGRVWLKHSGGHLPVFPCANIWYHWVPRIDSC